MLSTGLHFTWESTLALAEAYAEAKARCDDFERAIDRHAAAMAKSGHDFTRDVVIGNREKDAAWHAQPLAEIEAA